MSQGQTCCFGLPLSIACLGLPVRLVSQLTTPHPNFTVCLPHREIRGQEQKTNQTLEVIKKICVCLIIIVAQLLSSGLSTEPCTEQGGRALHCFQLRPGKHVGRVTHFSALGPQGLGAAPACLV